MKTKAAGRKVNHVEPSGLSEQLQSAVESSGLTAYRLAELTGVSHSVIGRWLRGERDLTLCTASKLADALDLVLKPNRPKRRPR
jgi:transcriptional regulator with XRE-family HTH domain